MLIIHYINDHHNNWQKVKAGEEKNVFVALRIKGRKKKKKLDRGQKYLLQDT